MSTHTRSIFALPAVIALLALTGCPNDPIPSSPDLETAEAAYYEKLQDCGILGEGRLPSVAGMIPPGYEETYTCVLDCIRAKSCSQLEAALCSENDVIYEQCWMRCEPPEFRCDDGERVPADFQCDGEADCMDGSDEVGCTDPGNFICGDGSAIPADYVCDYMEDCEDGSDEAGCDAPATFTCADGEVIAGYSECDEYPDCADGSDEAGCAQLQCF